MVVSTHDKQRMRITVQMRDRKDGKDRTRSKGTVVLVDHSSPRRLLEQIIEALSVNPADRDRDSDGGRDAK